MEVKEPAIAYSKRKYSIEEYLDLENASEEKHEYYQGEIFAMSGAKGQHIIISRNIMIELGAKLKGKPCQPNSSDMRIYIEKNTLFTYPDISVICGSMLSLNNDELNFLNPTIIVEILSPSTRSYDLGAKFELYRDIPTLKEYVTIDTDTISVQAWHINSNKRWELTEYKALDNTLVLQSIQTSIPLQEIYLNTEAGTPSL